MEKPQKITNLNNHHNKATNSKLSTQDDSKNGNYINNKRPIWDCDSTLYDSFELNSFQKQLDSAIISSSRTFSMPRLPSEIRQPPPEKKPVVSKFSRSFHKLLRSVFRAQTRPNSSSKPNSSSPDPWFLDHHQAQNGKENNKDRDGGRCFAVYEKAHGLSTIPEGPEVSFSPQIGSLVRKTMSDRFTAASVGIYCA